MKPLKKVVNYFLILNSLFLVTAPPGIAEYSQGLNGSAPQNSIRHGRRRRLLERLKLTSEQRKLLRVCRDVYHKKIAEIDAQIKVVNIELENELEKKNPDMERLDQLCKKAGQLYGEHLKESIRANQELERKILSPKQLDHLKDLQSQEKTKTQASGSKN